MLKKISIIVVFLVSLFGVALAGNTAFATSAYDNSYQTTNAVKMYKSGFGVKLAVAENTSPDSSVVQEKSIYEIREANERTRAKEALEVSNSQNTHPQEETDASSEVNRQENTSKSATHGTSETLSSNWVLLTVGGVALIAIVASATLWAVKRKK